MSAVEADRSHPPGHGVAAFVGIVLGVVIAMVSYGIAHRGAPYPLVLVTSEDCRRAFDDEACRAIVARAEAIHAATVPSFERREMCEAMFGRCTPLKDAFIKFNRYGPSLAAIALTSDRDAVVPLYFSRPAEEEDDPARVGRLVYFRSQAVGRLVAPRIGGAELPYIAARGGDPMTAAELEALRGNK